VQFLRGGAITGQPVRGLTDAHDGTINAARIVCPEPRMYRSEWHPIPSVETKLIAAKVHGNAKLIASFRQAFVNRDWWDQFRVKVHRLKLPSVERELDVIEPLMAECWRTHRTRRTDASIPSPAAAWRVAWSPSAVGWNPALTC
jgi:hypothetical protein